ncbi:hypothetical protein CT157_12730 [Pseudomonas syringae]|uniref:2-oxoglutarate dehydrogenase E1 component/KDG C-terminal domain-containing protein n=1 Tax=Pseudomonas syringae TaxID=317 RepID=A0A3T0JTP7_PSESX|nr:hypothetical protein CT157_12730 [Pseudomonas syringae]
MGESEYILPELVRKVSERFGVDVIGAEVISNSEVRLKMKMQLRVARDDVAIVRIEQLYPFPEDDLIEFLAPYGLFSN